MSSWVIIFIGLFSFMAINSIAENIKEWRIAKAQISITTDLAKQGCRINDDTGRVEYIPVYAKYSNESNQGEEI